MKMHVLFTGLVSKTSLSGGDQLFLDIAPRLPKNIKLVIITPIFGHKLWENIDQSNIEFRFLPVNWFDFRPNLIFIFLSYLIRSWQVSKILKKEKDLEIIYSCSDVAYADIWPAYLISQTKKIKWISRIYHVLLPPGKRQGNYLANFTAFYLQRLSFWLMKKHSSHILALNDKLKEEVLSLGFPKEKVGVLGAGIDFEKINCVKTPKKKSFDGIFVGRIHPSKGIYDLVKIWQGGVKRFPKAKAIIIGGGSKDQEKKLRLHIKRAHLSNNLIFAGYLSDRRLYHNFRASKIFLFTDYEAGWGLAIAEAMAAGLPVVGYNLEIFGDVFKKGFLTVPLGNTTIFAQKIIQLLENKGNYQQISQEATLQAQKMSWRKTSIKFQKKMKILTINFFLLFLSNYQTLFPKN